MSSWEEEKVQMEASQARLEKSQVDPKSYGQDLKDISGLFYAYEEMKDHPGDEVEGTMQTVLGLTEGGTREIYQVLRDRRGRICYIGNAAHPCPPYPEDTCTGG